jgi:hypothetical protein
MYLFLTVLWLSLLSCAAMVLAVGFVLLHVEGAQNTNPRLLMFLTVSFFCTFVLLQGLAVGFVLLRVEGLVEEGKL